VSHKQNLCRSLLKSTIAKSGDYKRVILAHQAIDAPYVCLQESIDAEAQKRLGEISVLRVDMENNAMRSRAVTSTEAHPRPQAYTDITDIILIAP